MNKIEACIILRLVLIGETNLVFNAIFAVTLSSGLTSNFAESGTSHLHRDAAALCSPQASGLLLLCL